MTRQRGVTTAKTVMRRRGRAEPPTVALLVAEVRSDAVIQPQPGPAPGNSLGPLVIEWTYCVPWASMKQFNQWLAQNEPFIANFCSTKMHGVDYRGTYVAINSDHVHYKTIWSYDSLTAVDQWRSALKAKTQKFYKTIRTLRSYWANSCCPKEGRYQPAALFAELESLAGSDPFTALTLDAAAQS